MIYELQFSSPIKAEFEDVQWKAWEIAGHLNPNSQRFGFNVNFSYQCEIYPEHDHSPKEEWEPGDLTWDNFISKFPSYLDFLNKYNFYYGITMISRAVEGPHRHGSGELTITYPLRNTSGINVYMVSPLVEKSDVDWLKNNEHFTIDETYSCKDGQPFLLQANHFHKTDEAPKFVNGQTIFTVWHELTSKEPGSVERLKERFNGIF